MRSNEINDEISEIRKWENKTKQGYLRCKKKWHIIFSNIKQ